MSRLYEVMTKVLLMGYTIRVWETSPATAADEIPKGPNHEITVGLRAAVTGEVGNLHVTPTGIAKVLDEMPSVSAYEILDPLGNGVVVYSDWP